MNMAARPMISGALELDMRYVYFSLPFAFTLQSIRLIERWWRILTKREVLVVPSEEVF
jgi:TRAP-type C4-dicarboxylate transport system permease small subunit